MTNEINIKVTSEDDTDTGFRSAESNANKFSDSIKNLLFQSGGDGGTGFALNFGAKAGPLMAKAPIGAPLATAVAAGGPAISAALVTSISLGAGLGAAALGAKLSAKDPRVAAGITDLKTFIGSELEKSTTPFIPAMLRSIDKAKVGFRSIRPELDAIFSKSSTYLDPLADGIIGLVQNGLPGLRELVDAAEPLVYIFKDELPELGQDFSDLMSSIADSAARNEDEFHALVDTLGLVVNQIQTGIDLMDYLGSGPTKTLLDLIYKSNDVIPGAKWIQPLDDVAEGFKEAAERAKEYEDAIRAQTDPAFALIDSIQDLRDAQNEYNEAVKEHGRNSPQARQALLDIAKASIEAQSAAQGAAGTFDGKLTPAMRATLVAAGVTEGMIAQLEREFNRARVAGEKFARTYQANVVVSYREEGRAVPIYDVPQAGIGGRAHGGVTGAASGGTRSNLTMVGEHGVELMELPPSTRVHSNPDTRRILEGNGGGDSGGGVILMPAPGSSEALMNEIVRGLLKVLRTDPSTAAEVRGE